MCGESEHFLKLGCLEQVPYQTILLDIATARGTVYAPPTALYTMTNITRKVLIFKNQNFEKFSVFSHQLVFYRG